MSEAENEKTPEELVNEGEWEVEPIYFGDQRGKLYRSRSTTELECYVSHDGVTYRPGDTVYMDTSTDAYLIGTICAFKQTKRDVLLSVTRFYRPEEVPEDSVSIMAAERGEGGEGGEGETTTTVTPREIFSSDNTCTHSISLLRGHCKIHHVKDIAESRTLDLSLEDTFFSCVVYNQESTRLASHNGEIRVGPSHQARLPPEATCAVADCEEKDRDELLWKPGMISPENEDKYLKLARTFRLVLLENDNIHEAEKGSRCRDLLLNDAIMTLHQCHYSFTEAIKVMNSNDTLFHEGTHFMTLEDTKKFGKGIKTIGKNFARIKTELLNNHERNELVSFYYLWKKSPDAIKPKPLNNRSRAAAGLRRGKKDKDKNSRPPSREFADYASASEGEMENFDENKRLQYACHHCYGRESRDWHHAGREPMLLCTDCRLYYKKYGVMRSVERPETAPECLFKRNSDEDEEEAGVRTRAGKEKKENGRKRSPSYGDEGGGGGSVNGEDEKERKQRRISNGKRKKSIGEKNGKRRKEECIKEEEDGEGEGEDDKKSSSISPTPSGEKKDYEEEEGKEANGMNGVKKVKEEKEENKDSCDDVIIINGDIDDEKEGEAADENEPVEECKEALTVKYPCATLFRAVRRAKGGNSCSRTDIIFTATPDNVAARLQRTVEAKQEQKLLKEVEERKRAEEKKLQQQQLPVQNGQNGQNGMQPGPSNIVHPMPRMPVQNMPQLPTDMSAFLQHIARQPLPNGLPAPTQYGFDPRQLAFMSQQQIAAAMMEQNQQMAAKQMQEAMIRRQVGGVPPSPFMNGMNGSGLFNGMPLNGMSAHMVAALQQQQGQHDPLAFARQQQIHQMMAGMNQTPVPPQQQQQPDQETMLRMQEFMQAMMGVQQQAAAMPPPPPPAAHPTAPVHPQFSQEALQQLMATMNGMNGNDMMRRLHNDSFKP